MQAQDPPNTYNIKYSRPWYKDQQWAETVTFTTPNPETLPVPNPDYLNIHAACARIAHLSGAGEYIDKIMRDIEDTPVLAKDGGSANLLEFALNSVLGQEILAH